MRIGRRKGGSPLAAVGVLLGMTGALLSLFATPVRASEFWVTQNDRDLYFTVTTAETLVFRTYAQQYSIDSMLWLYNQDGQAVAQNDDYFGLDSYISYAAQPGIYRLRAGVCCGNPNAWYGNSYRVSTDTEPTTAPSTTTSTSTSTSTTSTSTTTTTIPSVPIPASGTILVEANEGASLTVSAPEGRRFTSVLFASYGNPSVVEGSLVRGSCHAQSSEQVVQSLASGVSSFRIDVDNGTFGDPCGGTYKNFLALIAHEADPDYTTTTTSTTTTSTTTTSTTTTSQPTTTTTEPERTTTTTSTVPEETTTTSQPEPTTSQPATTSPAPPETTEPPTTTTTSTVPPTRNVTTTTRPEPTTTTTTEVRSATTTLPATTTTQVPEPAADEEDETPAPSVMDDPKVVELLEDMGFSEEEVQNIGENADELVADGFTPEQALAIAAEAEEILKEGFSEEDALRVAVEDASPLAETLGKSTRVKAKIGPISLRIVVTPTERRSIIAVGATMVFGGATILSGSSVSSAAAPGRRGK